MAAWGERQVFAPVPVTKQEARLRLAANRASMLRKETAPGGSSRGRSQNSSQIPALSCRGLNAGHSLLFPTEKLWQAQAYQKVSYRSLAEPLTFARALRSASRSASSNSITSVLSPGRPQRLHSMQPTSSSPVVDTDEQATALRAVHCSIARKSKTSTRPRRA
jgi:hypothetical protein